MIKIRFKNRAELCQAQAQMRSYAGSATEFADIKVCFQHDKARLPVFFVYLKMSMHDLYCTQPLNVKK